MFYSLYIQSPSFLFQVGPCQESSFVLQLVTETGTTTNRQVLWNNKNCKEHSVASRCSVHAPCHQRQIISNLLLEHDAGFAVLKWPPSSPDLSPVHEMWWNQRVTSWMCNQEICSTSAKVSCECGTKISEDVSGFLLNECHEERIRQLWRPRGGGLTWYWEGL